MMERNELQSGIALIKKDFQLTDDVLSLPDKESLQYENVLMQMTKIVDHLLSTDFNGLINILYRIDVPEEKLKKALAKNALQPSKTIAELIIQRELQKVALRKKYSAESPIF